MNPWGVERYGDPCRECGYIWAMPPLQASGVILNSPAICSILIQESEESIRHPDLDWPVVAYVSHMADNLRIWAERLVASCRSSPLTVARYDVTGLATARGYAELQLQGSLWGLERAVGDWSSATAMSADFEPRLIHPDTGELDLGDAILIVGHETHHHLWDIERTVAYSHRGSVP